MHALNQTDSSRWYAALTWWWQGLRKIIPSWMHSLKADRSSYVLLSLNNTTLSLVWRNRQERLRIEELDLNQETDRATLATHRAYFVQKKTPLTLVLPAQMGLCNTLSFPLTAEKNLEQILYYELEKVTPFNPAEIYFGHRIIEKNKHNKVLRVEFHAVPKNRLDAKLTQLKEVELEPNVVYLTTTNSNHNINLLPTQQKIVSSHPRWAIWINKGLLICAALMLVMQISLPFIQIEKKIRLTEAAMQTARQEVKSATTLTAEWESLKQRNKILNDTIANFEPVVLLLNEMTDILPDSTWLTDLSLNQVQIQISGESASASTLIQLIEQSDYFENTQFRSPVMTERAGQESFQIITHRQQPAKTSTTP